MGDMRFDGMLIDLSGVLYEGDDAIKGAADALARLQRTGKPIRFVTNTTRRTSTTILDRLERLGFDVEPSQLFSAPLAVKKVLIDRGMRPHLLIHPDLMPEFADLSNVATVQRAAGGEEGADRSRDAAAPVDSPGFDAGVCRPVQR